jgi:hypothetical protein
VRRSDFKQSPAILGSFRAEIEDSRGFTLEEIESAFVSWWAVVLHPFWMETGSWNRWSHAVGATVIR